MTSANPITGMAPAAKKRGRAWWFWCGAAVLLLALAGAAGARWWSHRPIPVDPPMPPETYDKEVELVLKRARDEVVKKPKSAKAWGELGKTLLAHLYDREADACFAEAARLAPEDAQWPYARGIIASKRSQDQAVPFFRQAVACSDSWPEARSELRLQLADELLKHEQLDEAEAICREELQQTPGEPRATFNLGVIAAAHGDNKAAEQYLSGVAANPFARKKATAQLAALAGGRGDTAAAAAYEKQCAALPNDPRWPDPFLDAVREYRVGRRFWEHQVEELEKDHYYAEAADYYLKQLDAQPTARNYIGAGINLARMNDFSRAVPLLREAIRIDPDSAHAHYSLAITQFTHGDGEMTQAPGSSVAKDCLGEAIEQARRTAELRPDHARAYLIWGMSHKLLGEPAKAVEPLQKGIGSHPEMFTLHIAMGEVYVDLGKNDEAATYLENASRLLADDANHMEPKDREEAKKRLAKDFERLKAKTK